jgi:hypothetical protein
MTDDIRLLRNELMATRQKITELLDAMDQRLAALQPQDEPRFKKPKDFRRYIAEELRKRK